MESYKKDQHLQLLQSQLSEAQQRIYQQPLIMGGDADLSQKLVHLESEVASKKKKLLLCENRYLRYRHDFIFGLMHKEKFYT
jgi:hypothetical protein